MLDFAEGFFQRSTRVSGLTHHYYRYPAATSPEIVRTLIRGLTLPGEWVLDPFMGGGTTIVEAIAQGRRAIGTDLNALAAAVARAKTSYVSAQSWARLETWSSTVPAEDSTLFHGESDSRTRNLPHPIRAAIAFHLERLGELRPGPERLLARCALLRVGQWCLESRNELPYKEEIAQKLRTTVRRMREGADELTRSAREFGIPASQIHRQRILKCGPASDLPQKLRSDDFNQKIKLVVTSPPYPGVHVLYHRWQVGGRRETAAPYWIARRQDGKGPAFYTMGGRSDLGKQRYFAQIRDTFASLGELLDHDALVLQTVAFADSRTQYPMFMDAMAAAGYRPATVPWEAAESYRLVPNRRWYARSLTSDSSVEMLIAHRLA